MHHFAYGDTVNNIFLIVKLKSDQIVYFDQREKGEYNVIVRKSIQNVLFCLFGSIKKNRRLSGGGNFFFYSKCQLSWS